MSDWRLEPGIRSYSVYRRKFAWLPISCIDGSRLWWKNYYSCQRRWVTSYAEEIDKDQFSHPGPIENITEAEYLVRKLAEKL